MRYLMTFSYDGSKYSGYQKQPKKKTIQSEIEKVLKKINSEQKVDIHASGRTDAGVHALNQKAHFDMDAKMSPDKLKHSINCLLPKDIYIKDIKEVNDDFHARFNVKAKEYVYKINMGEYNPLERNYVYQYNNRVDVTEIERAMKYLEGTHNFKSFTKTDEEKDDYVRTLSQTNLIRDLKDVNKIIYYINQSIIKNLTTRESREIIKNNSYSRMNKKLKYIALNKKYKKIKKTVI